MGYTPSRTRRAQLPLRCSDGATIGYTIHADHAGSAASFRVRREAACARAHRRLDGRLHRSTWSTETVELG